MYFCFAFTSFSTIYSSHVSRKILSMDFCVKASLKSNMYMTGKKEYVILWKIYQVNSMVQRLIETNKYSLNFDSG